MRSWLPIPADSPFPLTNLPYEYNPVLASIGHRYSGLLSDQSLLRMQLHAFAASDDPEIRDFVRQRFSGLITLVSERSGVPATDLRDFFAQGMLMNVAAAVDFGAAPDKHWFQENLEGRA